MNCPSCHTPLEPNARFCGVCGYRLQGSQPNPAPVISRSPALKVSTLPPKNVASAGGSTIPSSSPKQPARVPKSRPIPKGDEIYVGEVLNNRFKVESKIGEGGFGAVYRGIQLATGRKVALKLLHPEMTKDENLVARFRREGMVLCNLRDAHTITTYDFDQTPDGTLYIAMELLEGKSLHQVFHEQAPLEWKRMFKILIEMCSSLAEAHSQGIVHRDLKPENVYLETRPGNPEFVKILDFGIAKVMRGDTIDPQSPQLTATGQTLGTLEYMSPEQLMGKQLDGRSDVYALGVVAYEMTTGRLPFPDAKGPAGLITAQLKQTPIPPSHANPKAGIPPAADRAILKCLEKDKTNRHADVSAFAVALQDVLTQATSDLAVAAAAQSNASLRHGHELLETRRGDMPMTPPPPLPMTPTPGAHVGIIPHTPPGGTPQHAPASANYLPPNPHAHGSPQGHPASGSRVGGFAGSNAAPVTYPQAAPYQPHYPPQPASGKRQLIWWIIGFLVLGAGAGAVLAYFLA
ncbi:MAG: serine/threonine-protein kinase [Kofleriaceae bacterium]